MVQTKEGGRKARDTNYKLHGEDFYKKIGSIGGKVPTSKPKGFAANPALARLAGCKGGRISRRTKKDDIDKAEEVLEKESGRN